MKYSCEDTYFTKRGTSSLDKIPPSGVRSTDRHFNNCKGSMRGYKNKLKLEIERRRHQNGDHKIIK